MKRILSVAIVVLPMLCMMSCGDDEPDVKPNKNESFLKCPDNNHPHAIDLGLPSGTKWACCNVGAKTPEEYGGYYAWGETKEKVEYNWRTYAYFDSKLGYINIGSDIAGTSYDVAHEIMGGSWRMPSTAQQQELLRYCSHTWTQQRGVNGILMEGRNGGQVFLPAAGAHFDGYISSEGSYVDCWSSSHSQYSDFTAHCLHFDLDGDLDGWSCGADDRSYGHNVRSVCP